MSFVTTETVKADGSMYTVAVSIGSSKVKAIENDIAESFRKEAAPPGFRKGTATLDAIKTNYKKQVQAQAANELLRYAGQEILRKPEFRNFIGPQIVVEDKKNLAKEYSGRFLLDGSFAFTCLLEQPPQIDPQGYKNLTIEVPFAKFETWANKKILEAQIAHGQLEQLHPADDDLAKLLGSETLADYIETLRASWATSLEKPVKTQIYSGAMDGLIAANPFTAPVAWVNAEFGLTMRKLGFKEVPKDKNVIDAVIDLATKAVKSAYLLDLIYSKEAELQLSAEEIQKSLEEFALNSNMTLDEAIKILRQKGEYEGFVTYLEQNKTINFIIAHAEIKEMQA